MRAGEQRHQQPVVDVAVAEAGGELFEHRSVRLTYDARARPDDERAGLEVDESRAAGRPTRPRQERWQARSQASRCGRQASASAARTQYSIFQVQLALQSCQQASDIPDRGGAAALRIGALVDDAAFGGTSPAAGSPAVVAGAGGRGQTRASSNSNAAARLSWRLAANHAVRAASRRAVDAVGGRRSAGLRAPC